MKYSKIEIKPDGKKWQVIFSEDAEERERQKIIPFSLGFMYYPANWEKKRAFEKLQKHLIKRHEAEIKRLEASLSALEKLKCEE